MSYARIATYRHIARVRQFLGEFAIEMIKRGDRHDASKFDPVEMGPLEEMQKVVDAEGPALPGSDQYKRRTAMLGPMIQHHRQNNSHHPEFYEFELGGEYMHGINGMDLYDLVEMFFDWRAANVDRDAGAPMSLAFSCDKYKITGPLRHILFNTAERLGYVVDKPGDTYTLDSHLRTNDPIRVQRLQDAIEGECEGLAISNDQAVRILHYLDKGDLPE